MASLCALQWLRNGVSGSSNVAELAGELTRLLRLKSFRIETERML